MSSHQGLALTHSWPLFESGQRLDSGCAFDWNCADTAIAPDDEDMLAAAGIGRWRCDLADNSLSWSAGVYALFGLPDGAAITRPETVALYCELSRAPMERLRAYAIKHRRGFTIDARIVPVRGPARWMRLIAAPICDGRRVTHLHGLKRDVTHEY